MIQYASLKRLLVIFPLLTGCAHVSYENDTTSVSYTTLFKDIETLQAKVGEDTAVSVGSSQSVTLPLNVLQGLMQ